VGRISRSTQLAVTRLTARTTSTSWVRSRAPRTSAVGSAGISQKNEIVGRGLGRLGLPRRRGTAQAGSTTFITSAPSQGTREPRHGQLRATKCVRSGDVTVTDQGSCVGHVERSSPHGSLSAKQMDSTQFPGRALAGPPAEISWRSDGRTAQEQNGPGRLRRQRARFGPPSHRKALRKGEGELEKNCPTGWATGAGMGPRLGTDVLIWPSSEPPIMRSLVAVRWAARAR